MVKLKAEKTDNTLAENADSALVAVGVFYC